MIKIKNYLLTIVLFLLSGLSGCATHQTHEVVESDAVQETNDQFEPFNRTIFKFNETLDRHVVKPLANAYITYVPGFYRLGVTNFFDNLTYPSVFLNAFLQGKFKQGVDDTKRFLLNSTVGIGGVLDVATPMKLEKNQEDFGQTLAVWGVGQGSYLYLPLRGPGTVRNIPDLATRALVSPLTYLSSTILLPLTVLNSVNRRANLLSESEIRDEAAIEPYIFTREAYLQKRQHLIYDGELPLEGYDDIFEDDNGDSLDIE